MPALVCLLTSPLIMTQIHISVQHDRECNISDAYSISYPFQIKTSSNPMVNWLKQQQIGIRHIEEKYNLTETIENGKHLYTAVYIFNAWTHSQCKNDTHTDCSIMSVYDSDLTERIKSQKNKYPYVQKLKSEICTLKSVKKSYLVYREIKRL